MLKKITEPQALYQKEHEDGTTSAPLHAPKKKTNFKIIGGFIALALFLVVGAGGVAVVQRQRQLENVAVAPTAPVSKPAASEAAIDPVGSCELTYTIAPGATPLATCTGKTAALVTATGTTPITATQTVSANDIIEYTVNLQAANGAVAALAIEDTLPAGVDFSSAVTTGVTHQAGVVKFATTNLTGTTAIKYRVKVKALTAATDLINTVKFTNNGSGSAATTSCTSTVKFAPPVQKVQASCVDKLAYRLENNVKGGLIGNNATVAKAETFIYSIKVEVTGQSNGDVVVTDTLPAGMTYLTPITPATVTGQANADGRWVVTANLGQIGAAATAAAPEIAVVEFRVQMSDTATPATYANTASIKTGTLNPVTCAHAVKVIATGSAMCDYKQMFKSAGTTAASEKIADASSLRTGDTFWYRIQHKASDITKGTVSVTDTLPSSLEILELGSGVTKDGNKITASFEPFTGEKFIEVKVKVKDGTKGTVTNTATVSTVGADSSSCFSSFSVPELKCNFSCNSESECTAVNPNYTCFTTSNDGKRCRLKTNTGSISCQPPQAVVVGCNDRCVSNADCSNPSHICHNTGTDGMRCRLDSYVSSASCSPPTTISTPGPTAQPTLPQELPQTGPEDWANWLKAGLVTLGVGAVLLLLL